MKKVRPGAIHSSTLFISIIIASRSIYDRFVFETLASLSKQTYTQFEVILVLDKLDGIASLLRSIYPWLRVICLNGRPADKRNKAVYESRGDIIAFLDDDAYVPVNWIQNAIRFYRKHISVSLCGPGILPQHATSKEKLFNQILTSPIGSGPLTYRFKKSTPRYVDDFPSMNFFIRKDAFVSVGGFKQNYWPGEDSKLCELLVERNKQSIYYHPSLFVYHHRRATFKDFLIQHARYGFHRGAFFAHGDRNSRKIIYLMPSFFLLYILAFLISMLFIKIPIFAISPIALYGCILLMTSVVAYAKQNNILQSIIMVVLVSLIHITYGVYFIRGFIFPHQRLAL